MTYEAKTDPLIDEAVKHVQRKMREGLDEQTRDIRDRLKNLEQAQATGYGTSTVSKAAPLAKQVYGSDGFRAFAGGHSKNAKITIDGPLLRKNTIIGESGSPSQPDGVITQADRMAGIVAGAFRAPRIRDLLPVVPTSSNLIEFTREASWTNNAAPQQGEGATKAESDLTFELAEAPVRTIAHFIKASKQAISDQPALARLLDERMLHGVLMEEESQLLTGSGTGHDLDGLITNATAYSGAQTGDSVIDTLQRAIKQVQAADWTATGIVLNPTEWAEIELLKDNESRFIFGRPAESRPQVLWGLPVVVSNSMTAGQFLVADFNNAAVLWDREAAVVEMFEQDDTNVQKNLVTVRAEERVALTVIRPAAIVHGSF